MEYSKVIVIQIDSILKYPPTIALIQSLTDKHKDVYLLTTHTEKEVQTAVPTSVHLVNVGKKYDYSTSAYKKFRDLISIRRTVWKEIDRYYDRNTILWVMSNITIKHLGMRLLNYNYNLHLFELVDSLYYLGKCIIFKLDLEKLCNTANKVIVCEYNRANITQTWFRLRERPLIITNKPAKNSIEPKTELIHDATAKKMIEKLRGRKIILYQGIVDPERPVEKIAAAVEKLDGQYVFLVMTGSQCDNLKKYHNTYIMPFIAPPYHLEVTSHAYIGVLIYKPVYGEFSSPLNAIYCAPNKLYEYSQFGLPMIGNDIPGLKYQIDYNHMGVCIQDLSQKDILDAISAIESNYTSMSECSKNFFEGTSNERVIDIALMKNM